MKRTSAGKHSRAVGSVAAVVISGVLAAGLPTVAWSQDNPPIEVPTDPVPQGQPPPPTNKPKPQPVPANTGASNGGGGGGGGGSNGAGGSPASTGTNVPSAPTSFNNEGVFKISGTKGAGTVGGAKGASSTVAPKATGTPVATPKPKTYVAAKPKVALAIAEWPGFRMTDDGGSEVMVEFSKPIGAPTEHKAAGAVTYIFSGAHLIKNNNANPLLTIHFNTPVLDARLVQKKGGELHLIVELRPGLDVGAVIGQRAATDSTGQQFFVKFPTGSYLPFDEDDNNKPNAKTEQGKLKKPVTKSTGTTAGSTTGPKP